MSNSSSDAQDEDGPERIRVPNAAELVADEIRRRIASGELAEGSSLPPEGPLLEQFGVSGPTLRSAYRILESEGLISVRRGAKGGARILRPHPAVASRHVGLLFHVNGATLEHLFDALVALEGPLVREMVPVDGDDLQRLHRHLDAEREALDDAVRFRAAWVEFHDALMAASDANPAVSLLADIVWRVIEPPLSRAIAASPIGLRVVGTHRAAVQAHRRLLGVLAGGDGPRAQAEWERHLLSIKNLFADGSDGVTALVS